MVRKSSPGTGVKRKGEVSVRQAADIDREGVEGEPRRELERDFPEHKRESPTEKLEDLGQVE